MSLSTEAHAAQTSRFPRVSGDEPFKSEFTFTATQFSPRERG